MRLATGDDAAAIGQLLHDFNVEYDEPTPGPEQLAARVRELVVGGQVVVLLAGERREGFALLRFHPSLYSDGLECYLAELYVVPDQRGRGIGRALMEAALEEARGRGADYMFLGTSEDDVAARGLYERFGFTNREHPPDGPLMYVYEREL